MSLYKKYIDTCIKSFLNILISRWIAFTGQTLNLTLSTPENELDNKRKTTLL